MKVEKKYLYVSIEIVVFMLVIAFICFFTVRAIKSNNNQNNNNIVSEKTYKTEELKIGDVSINSSVEDVLNVLGTPEIKNEFTDEVSGDKVLELTYSNGATIVNFRDVNDGKGYFITYMQTSETKFTLPKNLKIGDSKETVLNSFSDASLVKDSAISENMLRFGPENNATLSSEGIVFWIEEGKVVSAAMMPASY